MIARERHSRLSHGGVITAVAMTDTFHSREGVCGCAAVCERCTHRFHRSRGSLAVPMASCTSLSMSAATPSTGTCIVRATRPSGSHTCTCETGRANREVEDTMQPCHWATASTRGGVSLTGIKFSRHTRKMMSRTVPKRTPVPAVCTQPSTTASTLDDMPSITSPSAQHCYPLERIRAVCSCSYTRQNRMSMRTGEVDSVDRRSASSLERGEG